MQNLKITLLQPDIIWENPTANFEKYTNMLSGEKETDLIVLPEMFSTGFSMSVERLKEDMNGISGQWMKDLALKKDSAVTGSLIIEDNGRILNRAIWVFPNGQIKFYDKRHLFSMGEEHLHYSPGKEKLIVDYKGWRFCPLICYDLRFPVWSRNNENYDVLIYMANWPSPRHHVWKNLLVARAVENQSYCVGVNRVGTDGNGLNYAGDSALVSPKGFTEFAGDLENVQTIEISYNQLHDFRSSFPLLSDKDQFKILP